MTRLPLAALGAALLLLPQAAGAQIRSAVRAQAVYEAYTFEYAAGADGKIAEFAVPVGIDLSFGRRLDLTISSGFISMDLDSASAHSKVYGMIDTELRLGYNVIPGRLVAIVSGALPTGARPDAAERGIVGIVASDVIGLAIPALGTGGRLGGGLVGAVPVGRFALGLGATYTYPFQYQPVNGTADTLQPGSEVRARVGLEGPLARRTFLRAATVFAIRSQDEFNRVPQPEIGQRFIGYLEVRQGVGRQMELTVYGYDVLRASPGFENTGVGQAYLPPGNLLVLGLRHLVPASRTLSIAPRAEWRMSTEKPATAFDANNYPTGFGSLRKVGSSVRVGVDVRQALGRQFMLQLLGSGLFGEIRPAGTDVSLSGWRAGFIVTYRP